MTAGHAADKMQHPDEAWLNRRYDPLTETPGIIVDSDQIRIMHAQYI